EGRFVAGEATSGVPTPASCALGPRVVLYAVSSPCHRSLTNDPRCRHADTHTEPAATGIARNSPEAQWDVVSDRDCRRQLISFVARVRGWRSQSRHRAVR